MFGVCDAGGIWCGAGLLPPGGAGRQWQLSIFAKVTDWLI